MVGTEGADVTEQAKTALAEVDRVLAAMGSSKSSVLKVVVWLADMADFAAMNAVYDTWIDPENPPVRAFGESRLATPGYKVEFIVTAACFKADHGGEEVCDEGPDGQDDPETCRTATVLMGYSFGRAVFDRRSHRLLFRAPCYQEDPSGPPQPGSLALAGARFTYTACGKDAKPVSFTLAELKACTPSAPATPSAVAEIKSLLATGRKATSEKRYPEALAAFDRVLAMDAGHARARGERGYARLRAGDLAGADADFTQAIADAGSDVKVQAAAWFNKGLVAETRGDAAAARAAFQQAHALRPSKATAGKLGLK